MLVVKRKVSAATWEREMVECYDSDSGPEPTLALPSSPLYARPAVKQEDAETTVRLKPFEILLVIHRCVQFPGGMDLHKSVFLPEHVHCSL